MELRTWEVLKLKIFWVLMGESSRDYDIYPLTSRGDFLYEVDQLIEKCNNLEDIPSRMEFRIKFGPIVDKYFGRTKLLLGIFIK